ncbi:hypothetical protein ACFL43_05350 [Thermodesulfobacteriota bacterium]
MGTLITLPLQSRFGGCPKCMHSDGRLNIGRDHWFYCRTHKVKWLAGSNVFADWQAEDDSRWKQNEEFLSFFMETDPVFDAQYPDHEEILVCATLHGLQGSAAPKLRIV